MIESIICTYCEMETDYDSHFEVWCEPYCEDCYLERFDYCNNCEDYYRTDYGYCESCDDEKSKKIHSYSYKPETRFHFKDNRQRFYNNYRRCFIGIELELENNGEHSHTEDLAEQVLNEYGGEEVVYLKEDGSLDDGFEIVSHPRTFRAWSTGNYRIYDSIFSLNSEGLRSHDTNTCGLHINLSRSSFSRSHLFRLKKFIFHNPYFITRISRRKKRNLQRWSPVFKDREQVHNLDDNLVIGASGCLFTTRDILKGLTRSNKYSAVNTCSDRVELRFFRGTLKRETFGASIEFAHALYEFTKSAPVKSLNPSKFLRFINSKPNMKKYINFQKWVSERVSSKEIILNTLFYENVLRSERAIKRNEPRTLIDSRLNHLIHIGE